MPRLAVLIDAENVPVKLAGEIITAARAIGDLNIVRLYGDFTEVRLSGWLERARAQGFQTMLQLSAGAGKNSTDIALTIDAMDILASGAVDAFCIASDDRDFLPLAARLRAAGKRVHAICRKADGRMERVYSSVLLLAPAEKNVVAAPMPDMLPKDEWAFVRDLIAELCETAGRTSVTPAAVGLELKRRMPKIAERIGGPKLVRRLRQAGIVIEHGDGSSKTISPAKAA